MAEIKIDSRESDSNFIALLADISKKEGYETIIETLFVGDIQFENIIIERKTPNDFCSSVCSNRLWEQAYKMKDNPDYASLVVIAGGWDKLWKDNIDKISILEGAVIQLLAWGIPVIRVNNDEELVRFALKIFSHAKPIDVPIKHTEKNTKMSLFMALPKIGRKTCRKMLKKFNNMEELVCASKEEIQNVVGVKKGEDVFNALRE